MAERARVSRVPWSQTPQTMAVVYSFLNGGSERLGALIADHLADAGWPVGVCATHAAAGPVRQWLEQKGIPTFGLDVDATSRIRRRWRIFRLLRQQRIEVLHVQHFSILALCYWPARLAGVRRIIVTEHNEELLRADPRVARQGRRYGARADLVTVIHDGIRRYLVDELGLPDSRVRTIPNGVDTARFAPAPVDPALRAELGAAPDDLLIGSVGRLHPCKDQRTLLLALDRLRRDHSMPAPVRLVLIGDGEERERLLQLCRELGLTGCVHFAGDRDDIARILPQLDVFVLSSTTEGVPLVLLEAMACGLPCVATRVGGVPELFRRGGGQLVAAADPAALADALAELGRDPVHRRMTGARAREAAVAHYDAAAMLTSYRQMLLEPNAGGAGPTPGQAAAAAPERR